jgi:lipopolysaccharide export LptBFGC system permease protein LptF
MTTNLERELKNMLSTTTTLRLQPVAPEQDSTGELVVKLIGSVFAVLLGAWFVCLGTLAAHGYWPAVPALAYWPAVAMLLGLQTVAFTLRGPSWKWARR